MENSSVSCSPGYGWNRETLWARPYRHHLRRELEHGDEKSPWQIKIVAMAGLFLITWVNCSGRVAGARVANAFLLSKLLAIMSIAISGIAVGLARWRQKPHPSVFEWFGKDPNPTRQAMPVWVKIGEFITAIYGVLFCYGGWETVSVT